MDNKLKGWRERFEEKWRLYMGDCKCNKEAFFIPFIERELASERAQVVKECMAALPKEHSKEALGAASGMTFVKMKAENAYRAAALEALQKLTQEV